MKSGLWSKTIVSINAVLFFSLSFAGYLPSPRSCRSLQRLAIEVGRQHTNIRSNQEALLREFKKSISNLKSIKASTLHSIVTAIGNTTRFTPYLKEQQTIKGAINTFDKTEGFTRVLAQLIAGTINNDKAHFNGPMAEIKVALDKVREGKKVIEFNKVITNTQGKPLTEIDIVTEDGNRKKTWHEVKSRKNRIQARDREKLKQQENIQKALANAHGASNHELIILRKPL